MKKIAPLAFILLAGCASLWNTQRQTVSFVSDPPGAMAVLSTNVACETPCKIKLVRKDPVTVTFRKDGCTERTIDLKPTVTATNSLMSLANDYETGAAYSFTPNPVVVSLTCLK